MGQNYEVTNTGLVKFRQKGTEQLVLEQGATLPVDGITGQIFWKTDTQSLRVHDGASFRSVGAWIDNGTTLTLPSPGRQVLFSDGTAALPSLSFGAQPNKGLFNAGSNLVGFAAGGALVATLSNNADLTLSAGGSYYLTPAVSGVTPRLFSVSGELAIATQNVTQLTVGYSGNVTLANGQVIAPNGVVGAPTYSYSADPTTGHYRDATYLNSVVGGVTLLRAGSGHIESVNGTAGSPTYSYINSQNAGAYLVSANIIAWSTASTEALRIDASQNITASGPSLSLTKSNAGGTQLIAAINSNNTANSHAVLQANVGGSSAGDAFSLYGVLGVTAWSCGIDNSDSDKFKISASSFPGTNDYFIIDPVSGVVSMPNTTFSANQVLAVNGSAGAPSIAFVNSSTSGWYRYGSDQIGLSLAGTGRWYWSGDTMVASQSTAQILLPDGAVGTPALNFGASSHGNYGLYYNSGDVCVSVGGAQKFGFSASYNYSYVSLRPSADASFSCGLSGARWSAVYCVNLYTGDLNFDNGWAITEGDKVGLDKDDVILLSPTGKRFRFVVSEVV